MSTIDPTKLSHFLYETAQQVLPPCLSIIPTFSLWVWKTDKQLGKPKTIHFRTLATASFKAGPTVAMVVATQLIFQKHIEKHISTLIPKSNNQWTEIVTAVISSGIVGGFSGPFLAALNGFTTNTPFMASIKSMTPVKYGAIAWREGFFVLSNLVSYPVVEKCTKIFGTSRGIQDLANFTIGAVGSLLGHPADTILTLKQNGQAIQFKKLMRGASYRATGSGMFLTIMKRIEQLFNEEQYQVTSNKKDQIQD